MKTKNKEFITWCEYVNNSTTPFSSDEKRVILVSLKALQNFYENKEENVQVYISERYTSLSIPFTSFFPDTIQNLERMKNALRSLQGRGISTNFCNIIGAVQINKQELLVNITVSSDLIKDYSNFHLQYEQNNISSNLNNISGRIQQLIIDGEIPEYHQNKGSQRFNSFAYSYNIGNDSDRGKELKTQIRAISALIKEYMNNCPSNEKQFFISRLMAELENL